MSEEIVKVENEVEVVEEKERNENDIYAYNLLKKIADSSLKSMIHRKNDFETNGMLYCGVCGQEKWGYINFKGLPSIKRWKQCRCDEEEYAVDEENKRIEEFTKRVAENKEKSGMLRTFTTADFDRWVVKKDNELNKQICERYVEKFKDVMMKQNQGLLFWGDTGRGKTWAAACIGKKLLAEGYSVRMTSSINIVQGDEDITRASLLIIDDFGAERGTEYAVEKICKAIDDRYNVKKPFVITTNNTLGQMTDEPDIKYRRMYERILECCYPVQFFGTNMRMGMADNRFKVMKEMLER